MDKLSKDLIDAVKQAYNLTDREHREILKLYNQSRNNVRQFIADLYMNYGVDGELDYDEYLMSHAHDTEQFITNEAKNIVIIETAVMAVILDAVLNHTYNKSAYYIEKNLQVGINFNLLRPEFITTTVNYNWSGIPFSERIWGNQEALVRSLRQELAQGLQAGESLDKMAKRIDKQFNSKAYESQRLIRTESARVISEAQEQIYKDTGVVERVQFMATLDNRTSKGCQKLDGQKFRLDDENKPQIPRHPNCRSCWIAIPFDDYEVKVRKDNITKKIIKYQTYKEWAMDKGIK